MIINIVVYLCNRDEKTDAHLQVKEELEHKNKQFDDLRKEVRFITYSILSK